jgi:hypothetical protein
MNNESVVDLLGRALRVKYSKKALIQTSKLNVNGCLNSHIDGEHIIAGMVSMTEGAPTPSFLFA